MVLLQANCKIYGFLKLLDIFEVIWVVSSASFNCLCSALLLYSLEPIEASFVKLSKGTSFLGLFADCISFFSFFLPILCRSDKPYQFDPGKSMPPTLEPDFIPGSQIQIKSGRRPIAYTDSIFYGNSDEPPRSQIPPPENIRLVIFCKNSFNCYLLRNVRMLYNSAILVIMSNYVAHISVLQFLN